MKPSRRCFHCTYKAASANSRRKCGKNESHEKTTLLERFAGENCGNAKYLLDLMKKSVLALLAHAS